MPKFRLPGPPEPPAPPDPSVPFRIVRKIVSNTKHALKEAKQGMKDLGEEIKKPFDNDDS